MPLARSEEAAHWYLIDVVLSWEYKALFSLHSVALIKKHLASSEPL